MAKKKAAKKPDASTERGVGQQNPKAFKPTQRPAVKRANKRAAKRADVRDVRRAWRQETRENRGNESDTLGPDIGSPGASGGPSGPGGSLNPGDVQGPVAPGVTLPGGGDNSPGGDDAKSDPWPLAATYLRNMGFTEQQVASLKNQLWGTDSELKLYYGQDGWEDLVVSKLYDTPEFAQRFPAVVQSRAKNPMDFISVGEVLEYENNWEKIMPPGTWGMFDKRSTITSLMLGGVSLNELQDRVQTATWAAATAPPGVRDQLSAHYGVSPDALIGFYLDPTRGEEWLQSETMTAAARAAGIGSGIGLSWEQARRAAAEGGYTGLDSYGALSSQVARAAAYSGLQSGLGSTVGGEDFADFIGKDDRSRLEQVAAQRTGRFNTSGGAGESQQGVTGLRGASAT